MCPLRGRPVPPKKKQSGPCLSPDDRRADPFYCRQCISIFDVQAGSSDPGNEPYYGDNRALSSGNVDCGRGGVIDQYCDAAAGTHGHVVCAFTVEIQPAALEAAVILPHGSQL